MRKKNYFIILIFFIVLIITGCKPKEKDQKIVFKEPEGYVFDSDLFLKFFEGIKERNQNDFKTLFWEYYFKQDYIPNLNPAETASFELKEGEYWQDIVDNYSWEGSDVFKKEDGYQYYTHLAMKERYVPVPYLVEGKYEFRFHSLVEDLVVSSMVYMPYGYITDIIRYEDTYGYMFLMPGEGNAEDIFYLFANTKNLPYDIYYETETHEPSSFKHIYLIPKDESFSKKCLLRFMEKETIHYYDIELMQEKMKGLSFNELNNG